MGQGHPQRFGHQRGVVSAVGEVEAHHVIECFAVQRADRQHVRHLLEHQQVLFKRRVKIVGIDVPAVDPPGLDRQPPLLALVLVLFEYEIAVVASVKVAH